ncbi:MAG: ribonuclease R [Halothiobacillaceae bacterium]|nr:MAG: ribonuclease R [Halothiobacillaceae bacterium]
MSKKPYQKNDPYAAREAEKYANPLPSREYILQVLAEAGAPMTLRQLVDHFVIENEDEQEALGFRLRAMERDGQLIRNRRNGYGLVSKMDLVCGRVMAHPDGFGFLLPDEAGEDIYLAPKQMRSLGRSAGTQQSSDCGPFFGGTRPQFCHSKQQTD